MLYIHKLTADGQRKRAGKGFQTMNEAYDFIRILYLFHDDYEIEMEVGLLRVYSKWNSTQKWRTQTEYELTGREETQIVYRAYQWDSNQDEGKHSTIGNEWQFKSYDLVIAWFHKMVQDAPHTVTVIPMIDPITETYYEQHRNQFVVLEYLIGGEYTTEVYQIYVEEMKQ